MHLQGQCSELAAVKTGRLKGSVTFATESTPAKPRAPAKEDDGVKHDGQNRTVIVGTNVDYGVWVEYGTERTAAQSFMRDGYEAVKDDLPQVLEIAYAQSLKHLLG
jgi:hypothetical protein